MKKILALLLAAAMCLPLAACGIGEDAAEDNIYIEEGENGLTYIVFPNSRVFSEHVVKVEITNDNWHEYFEDYEYTEHIVITNDFGDIEEEYDEVRIGFGLKRSLLGLTDTVSFKFDGMTEYSRAEFNRENADTVEYEVYTADQASYSVYSYMTDELIEEEQLDADEVREYYLLEIKYDRSEDKLHFGEHNCIDAVGVLYLVNLPEGIYHGEEVNQITWASGGGAGFGTSILRQYAED
ncbi:MAG: hypothetical protein IJC35_07690 [Oscillospiraceae bacterium]|nr:hypothetical protein [Oscillospiraceae bacterium]